MSNEIIKVIDELAKRFGIIIDWTSENVMPYLLDLYERFIAYNITFDVIFLVVCVGVIVAIVKVMKVMIKNHKYVTETRNDSLLFEILCGGTTLTFMGGIVVIAIVFSSILATVFGITIVSDLLQLIFIPELYTMDWITSHIS